MYVMSICIQSTLVMGMEHADPQQPNPRAGEKDLTTLQPQDGTKFL